ncbi:MAG: hypothetical protein PVH52_07640, partial [bacterium]
MRNSMMRAVLIWLVPALLAMSAPAGRASAGDMPGSEIMLPQDEVVDRFFAYMIGLIQADTCGVVDAEDLASALAGFKGRTSVPFERIMSIHRDCGDDGPSSRRGGSGSGARSGGRGGSGGRGATDVRDVSITFSEELKTPVPYQILGYHPGSVQACEIVRFREWHIPRRTIRWTGREPLELSDVYVFGIR